MNGLPSRQPIRLITPSAVSTRVVGNESPAADGALDVVHRLDEIVDAERNRGDQDDAEVLEAAEHVPDFRHRQREAEGRERIHQRVDAQPAIVASRRGSSPRR